MKTIGRSFTSDAFLSHASQQARIAKKIVNALAEAGLSTWIDDRNMKFGLLLRKNLQDAIRDCRCVVLLWSEAAQASRWVMMEVVVAFHSDRTIIPCAFDSTPLPQFLQNVAFLQWQRDRTQIGEKLAQAIRQAPDHANEVPMLIASKSAEVIEIEQGIATAQKAETDALGEGDFLKAAKVHELIDQALKTIEPVYRWELMVLNLGGFHRKNAYLQKHWDAIQAGRAPADPLLQEAERRFFDALSVDPSDPSALNGLGSILMFEREWDEAEFLQRRAIQLAGGKYPAAEHDLALILSYKKQSKLGLRI